MRTNSNQQKHSLSIRDKRQAFKAQIRRQQLQDFFANKRKQLFIANQANQIYQKYHSLNNRIEKLSGDTFQLIEIQDQIWRLIKQNPGEEFNLMIVGNILISNSNSIFSFEEFILGEENINKKLTQTHFWCFGVYLKALDQVSKQKNCIYSIERADQILACFIRKFWEQIQYNSNFKIILQYISFDLSILMNILQDEYNFFPVQSFSAYIKNLQIFYKQLRQINIGSVQKNIIIRRLKMIISRVLIESIEIMKKKQIFRDKSIQHVNSIQNKYYLSNQKSTISQLTKCMSIVFYQNIKDGSDLRFSCIQCIKIMCQKYPFQAGQHIFAKKMTDQLLFLMSNHSQKARLTILKAIGHIFPKITNHKLIQFLNNSLHINIVMMLGETIKVSNDNQIVIEILNMILILFKKAQSMDQRTFNMTYDQMISNGLYQILQLMNTKRYSEEVEIVYTEIIDNYFSCDEEEINGNSNMLYEENYSCQESINYAQKKLELQIQQNYDHNSFGQQKQLEI